MIVSVGDFLGFGLPVGRLLKVLGVLVAVWLVWSMRRRAGRALRKGYRPQVRSGRVRGWTGARDEH